MKHKTVAEILAEREARAIRDEDMKMYNVRERLEILLFEMEQDIKAGDDRELGEAIEREKKSDNE